MINNFFGPLSGIACFWPIFLVFACVSMPVIIVGWKRAQWRVWELSAFIIPYWTWAMCNLIDDSGKSLANVAVELMLLGLAVPAAALIRVAWGPWKKRLYLSAALIGAICCLAICLWAFVPCLPE